MVQTRYSLIALLCAVLSLVTLVPGRSEARRRGAAKAKVAACIKSCEATRDTCNHGCDQPGDPDEIRGVSRVSQRIDVRDRRRLVLFQNVANKVAPNEAAAACH